MPKKALQQRLNELHGELGTTSELDPELERLLREVANDIERLLDESTPRERTQAGEELEDRIRHITVDFETEHPRLAHILSDLADTLTKLGI
ncbi:MAG TPA: DUF4404 family protein [Gammaproteobacteria bacterium]|nr:DUF4404 family protein [Gammaproteobacteria bacterium]